MDHDLRIGLVPGKGRGVFANRDLPAGQVLEYAPLLIFPEEDIECMKKTLIAKYWFRWNKKYRALALGHASIFNHSYNPNIVCYPLIAQSVIKYITIRPVKEGEELVVNYNGDHNGNDPLKPMPFDVIEG